MTYETTSLVANIKLYTYYIEKYRDGGKGVLREEPCPVKKLLTQM